MSIFLRGLALSSSLGVVVLRAEDLNLDEGAEEAAAALAAAQVPRPQDPDAQVHRRMRRKGRVGGCSAGRGRTAVAASTKMKDVIATVCDTPEIDAAFHLVLI